MVGHSSVSQALECTQTNSEREALPAESLGKPVQRVLITRNTYIKELEDVALNRPPEPCRILGGVQVHWNAGDPHVSTFETASADRVNHLCPRSQSPHRAIIVKLHFPHTDISRSQKLHKSVKARIDIKPDLVNRMDSPQLVHAVLEAHHDRYRRNRSPEFRTTPKALGYCSVRSCYGADP